MNLFHILLLLYLISRVTGIFRPRRGFGGIFNMPFFRPPYHGHRAPHSGFGHFGPGPRMGGFGGFSTGPRTGGGGSTRGAGGSRTRMGGFGSFGTSSGFRGFGGGTNTGGGGFTRGAGGVRGR